MVTISHAYVGDRVVVLPNAARSDSRVSDFTTQWRRLCEGAATGPGHRAGRMSRSDPATTIDRGALGDTVIGEGSKLDNLVHDRPQLPDRPQLRDRRPDRAWRAAWCWKTAWCWPGQVGLGDHSRVGAGRADGSAVGHRIGVSSLEGGVDYGGVPAKPVKRMGAGDSRAGPFGESRKTGRDMTGREFTKPGRRADQETVAAPRAHAAGGKAGRYREAARKRHRLQGGQSINEPFFMPAIFPERAVMPGRAHR